MKRCPECRKDYRDETLLYCLDDGAQLVPGTSGTEHATAILPADRLMMEQPVSSLAGATSSYDPDETDNAVEARWSRKRKLVAGTLAGVVIIALGAAVLPGALKFFRGTAVSKPAPMRFVIPAPEKATQLLTPAVSPDGRTLIFSALFSGGAQLWQRSMDSTAVQPLPGVSGLQGMHVWSPDSRSIAFPADGKLKRLDFAAGPPRVICDLSAGAKSGEGASGWNNDGVILFTSGAMIYRVSADGGEPELIVGTINADPKIEYRWPYFLPDGRHFVFSRADRSSGTAEIQLASLDNKETTRLTAADSQAIYFSNADGGYLAFVRGSSLVAQSFDPAAGKFTGEPVVISETVYVNQAHRGMFNASGSGLIMFYSGSINLRQQLKWVDRSGAIGGSVGAPAHLRSPEISPDGTRVSVARKPNNPDTSDIYVIDTVRGTESRFTFSDASDTYPMWSPDGGRICWTSSQGSAFQIYQKASSGAGSDELLTNSDTAIAIDSWSPDGRSLLFDRFAPQTKQDLWILPLDGDRQPVTYLNGPFNETQGRVSPDGHWVVYTSDESGRPEIYLQSYPATAAKVQVSVTGGSDPKWRGDGKELFYISADNKFVAVDVRPNGGGVGVPKPLFDLGELSADYAATADGQRFLFATQGQQGSVLQYDLIANWTAGQQK